VADIETQQGIDFFLIQNAFRDAGIARAIFKGGGDAGRGFFGGFVGHFRILSVVGGRSGFHRCSY
jgi:hypothetical protein